MATTKIWAIKDSLSRVLDYAANPKKTVYSDLRKALHYANDKSKVVIGEEEACFVTGVNCCADTAFDEMRSVQERFGKRGGNVAYHAYQSFKTNEVSPELCHRVGVELARRMWGDGYQVLVATHFNTGTYHNHFVVNAVNMWDGKKFNCNEGAYWKFRALSDELCAEHRLTVIKNPLGKTPRQIYFAEKNGEPTKFNLMREAIDFAISCSRSFDDFKSIIRENGYIVELNPNRRYWTIRSENSKKAVRMYRLGEEYCGLRRGEALGLEFKDVDFENSILTIIRTSNYNIGYGTYTDTPKTKASCRKLFIQPKLMEMIKEVQAENKERAEQCGDLWHESDRLFVNWCGKPANPNYPYVWLRKICETENVPFHGLHSFRHFVATQALADGVDVKSVSAMLGHSQTSTTLNIYAHAVQQANEKALNHVAALLEST